MDSVNKTLYIPLYGKSYVSKRGLFLEDKKAEEIWQREQFPLKGKSKSKWLSYYMGIRSRVFDDWVKKEAAEAEGCVVLHIGCGMDSRILRVGDVGCVWYDVDFPDVIEQRRRYFEERDGYYMISADVRERGWLDSITQGNRAIVVMEGVSMYLRADELRSVLSAICDRFESVSLLMDAYTVLAAKLSRYKNPINDVGVTAVYGFDDPLAWAVGDLSYLGEREMTPQKYIDELSGTEKWIFRKLYAGGMSKRLYRLYAYGK